LAANLLEKAHHGLCQYTVLTLLHAQPYSARMPGKIQQLQIRVTAAEKSAIQRAAAAANLDMSRWVLSKLLPPGAARFQALIQALAQDAASVPYTLAELNDLLTAVGPKAFAMTVAGAPASQLSPYLGNYVAAMVETAAHQKDIRPPSWTMTIAALARPQFASPLPGLRLHLLLSSPPAFRRRNLFIDSSIGDRV
jgi:Protein of unknown function (DUF1778)